MSTDSSNHSTPQDAPFKYDAALERGPQHTLRVAIVTMVRCEHGEFRACPGVGFYADEQAAAGLALLQALQNYSAMAAGDDTYRVVYIQALGDSEGE